MRTRRARLAVALAALAAAVAPAAQAAAPADYATAAREMAAPWPGLQRADGSFREYVTRRNPRNKDDYGEAMLGYGLLQVGIRENDDALVSAGIRGVTHDARLRDADEPIRMFRNMAVASAYNLARERIGDHPGFAAARAIWEQRLRQVRISRLDPRRKVTNKALVEAVLVLELNRSGLSGTRAGTVLADLPRSMRLVERTLSRRVPASRSQATRLIGDSPDFPLAYHALSTGFLARALELMGDRAPARMRAVLTEALAASWALTGPDGDLAYTGRSQEQIWALSLTAHAAESARTAGAPGGDRLGALADRALARLRRDHRGGPAAFAITPALARDVAGGTRGIDTYASAVQYTGLGLVGLNWAHEAARPDRPSGALAADLQGGAILGRGPARFATVRAGAVWFAVRQRPATDGDLRSDFGLVALKVQRADGSWDDVLPIRPRAQAVPDTAGPVLVGRGRELRPQGGGLTVSPAGVVTIIGPYRPRHAGSVSFEPVDCGVRMRIGARPGETYEYSSFVRRSSGSYSSGTDPRLARLRARIRAVARVGLVITVC